MKVCKKEGQCIQCGADTNIRLDNGKFACRDCLTELNDTTRNIENELYDLFAEGFEAYMNIGLGILNCFQRNNIDKVDNCIKAIEALVMKNKYQNGKLDKKSTKKINKMVDKLKNIW